MKQHRAWMVAACVAALAAGCKPSSKSSTATNPAGARRTMPAHPKIALVFKAQTNPFFAKMAEGAQAAADRLKVQLIVLGIDRENDFEQQARQVESAVAQGAHAILIAPADSHGIVDPLKRAADQDVLIINLDNRIDKQTTLKAGLDILTFIGPDNKAGAEKATSELIRRMGGKGKIAMLEGIQGADNAAQRAAGFMAAVMETAPRVQLAGSAAADWDTAMGQQKMEGLLAQHPDLNGVFCANDNMALGAIQAIEAAGKAGQIFVTSYDNIQAAQDAIRAGKLHATIEQHPELMGQWGVEFAYKALGGEDIPKEIPVPTDLVTLETLEKH